MERPFLTQMSIAGSDLGLVHFALPWLAGIIAITGKTAKATVNLRPFRFPSQAACAQRLADHSTIFDATPLAEEFRLCL